MACEHHFVTGLKIAIDECHEGGDILGFGARPTTNPQKGDICDVCGQMAGEPDGTIDQNFAFAMKQLAQFNP